MTAVLHDEDLVLRVQDELLAVGLEDLSHPFPALLDKDVALLHEDVVVRVVAFSCSTFMLSVVDSEHKEAAAGVLRLLVKQEAQLLVWLGLEGLHVVRLHLHLGIVEVVDKDVVKELLSLDPLDLVNNSFFDIPQVAVLMLISLQLAKEVGLVVVSLLELDLVVVDF